MTTKLIPRNAKKCMKKTCILPMKIIEADKDFAKLKCQVCGFERIYKL
jgi:hypothetical protein